MGEAGHDVTPLHTGSCRKALLLQQSAVWKVSTGEVVAAWVGQLVTLLHSGVDRNAELEQHICCCPLVSGLLKLLVELLLPLQLTPLQTGRAENEELLQQRALWKSLAD